MPTSNPPTKKTLLKAKKKRKTLIRRSKHKKGRLSTPVQYHSSEESDTSDKHDKDYIATTESPKPNINANKTPFKNENHSPP